jgi:predicted transport protein
LSGDAEFDEEGLEVGEMYITFKEEVLFVKVETQGMKLMTSLRMRPAFRRWVDYA